MLQIEKPPTNDLKNMLSPKLAANNVFNDRLSSNLVMLPMLYLEAEHQKKKLGQAKKDLKKQVRYVSA